MNVALLAAIVGLLMLIANDWFGKWNKNKYRAEKKAGKPGDQAFADNRRRKTIYDRTAFFFLVIAAGLSIFSAFADKRDSDKVISSLKSKSTELETKIKTLKEQAENLKTEAIEMQRQLRQTESGLSRTQQLDQAVHKIASLERDNRALGQRVSSLERRLRATK